MLSLPVSLYCCFALCFASLVAAFSISSFAPSSCHYSLDSRCLLIFLLLVINMFSDFCLRFVLDLSFSLSLCLRPPLLYLSTSLCLSHCLSVCPSAPPSLSLFPSAAQSISINQPTIYLSIIYLHLSLHVYVYTHMHIYIYVYISTYLSLSLPLSLSISLPVSPISLSLACSLARFARSWVSQIWRFQELVALFKSPYNKESSIIGVSIRAPDFGNSHMQVHGRTICRKK